jgi:hypothetical protein
MISTPERTEPKYRIGPLPPNAVESAWVTLVKCGKVVEADFVRAQLEGAGLPVFIPDENVMAIEAWALNAFGYIRVQVRPRDYEAARELLCSTGDAVAEE